MTKRQSFVRSCLSRWGDVVLWGHLDCSDLGARAREFVGVSAGDETKTHTAQRYADEHPEDVERPLPGDFGFFGKDWQHVVHVVYAIDARHCVSADGATSRVKTLRDAEANGARVRIHTGTTWYGSAPFLGWRRHHELDQ